MTDAGLSRFFQLVTTPTEGWLSQQLTKCEQRFWVASPFVTSFLHEKMSPLATALDCQLVTNTEIRTFITKASDLDTLDKLTASGVKIKSVCRLHAKAYVIDDKAALVTSANATHSGMWRNRECGVATTDSGAVKEVAAMIEKGFGASDGPSEVTAEDLRSIRGLSEQFAYQRPEISMQGFAEDDAPKFIIRDGSERFKLLSQFSGWRALTLEGVLSLPKDSFVIDDLETILAVKAAEKYPDNNNVRAKLRQQLQQLRDLGLVEFLGDGSYRRLIGS